MTTTWRNDTVVVLGLGDLGARVVDAVARLPVGRVVAVARDAKRAAQVAGQAAVVAALSDGADRVEPARADLADVAATSALLRTLAPSVVVMAASRHTWWRTPHGADLPYGAWLPLQAPLVRAVVQARDDAGVTAPVVALPYPDAVGPMLAPSGLAPDVGAGNVAEVAAKLAVLAAARAGVPRREVEVRLIAHHAAERLAFVAFEGLAGGSHDGPDPGPPPFRAAVAVRGEPLPDEEARALVTAAYPLLAGRDTHPVTAAATAALVAALLGDEPVAAHAPAPGGRPGGYPIRASRAGVTLDLPAGVSEADAIAINAVAARWDGIERIGPDGTITFTEAVAAAMQRLLGTRVQTVTPGEVDDVADALEALLRRAA